jgi:type I restriction enzyme, S subunit
VVLELNDLPDGWRIATMDEIKANEPGAVAIGPFGSRMKADLYVSAGIPVIRGNNISDTHALSGEFVYVSEELGEQLRSSLVYPGDLVFPHRGAIGEVGIVPAGKLPRYMLSTSLMKISCNLELANPYFVLYYFRSLAGRREILRFASTVGTPGIGQPLTSLRSMRLPLPPLAEQNAIAEVLGAFDDRIDGNRKTAETARDLSTALLEQAIQAADASGKLDTVSLGELADVNQRSIKPSDGSIHYLDISSVGDGDSREPIVLSWSDAPGRARRCVADGDVLWSTVRPNRRSHCLIVDPPDDLVVSTGFAVLTPKSVGPSFLYALTERQSFVAYLVSVAEGSAYPAVLSSRFLSAPVPLPPVDVVAAYEARTMPLRRLAAALQRESVLLSQQRDTLLPVLLAGALRVREGEDTVVMAI